MTYRMFSRSDAGELTEIPLKGGDIAVFDFKAHGLRKPAANTLLYPDMSAEFGRRLAAVNLILVYKERTVVGARLEDSLAIVDVLGTGKSLNLLTTDVSDVYLDRSQVSTLQQDGLVEPVHFRASAKRCAGYDVILRQLQHIAEFQGYEATIFGSLARGKVFPGDIDIMVKPQPGQTLHSLMGGCRQHYGQVDAFSLRTGDPEAGVPDELWTRDESALDWVKARHGRGIMASAKADGIPLGKALDQWRDASARREQLATVGWMAPGPSETLILSSAPTP